MLVVNFSNFYHFLLQNLTCTFSKAEFDTKSFKSDEILKNIQKILVM